MTKMRFLITGGAGCLGSNLIERLLPMGHAICIIDNFATSKHETIPLQSDLMVIEGSIANEDVVNKAFDIFKPTHVIHSAAAYKNPMNWCEDTTTNVLGTIHVAKAAAIHNVIRFINFQTALCYGHQKKMPIGINQPTVPFTSYGISKTAGEAYLLQSGLPLVSLRLANICSPRLAVGPIPTFYKRLKAGQKCFCSETKRDFLDISDFFTLMDLVLQHNAPTGVFNVSTGEGKTIHDVFMEVASYLNIIPGNVPIIPPGSDDVPELVLDPSATQKAFGWVAKMNFKDTIINQLRWYDEYGVNNIHSHLASPTIKRS